MKDSRIPLYLITGFLDSGKTTLLSDTLNMDYFNDGQRTVLIMCEDGKWLHFDLVPGEFEIREGGADYTGRLCVIGAQLQEDKLEKLFQL